VILYDNLFVVSNSRRKVKSLIQTAIKLGVFVYLNFSALTSTLLQGQLICRGLTETCCIVCALIHILLQLLILVGVGEH
jgi:hypothetical protein